jgi:hypothetical protein
VRPFVEIGQVFSVVYFGLFLVGMPVVLSF